MATALVSNLILLPTQQELFPHIRNRFAIVDNTNQEGYNYIALLCNYNFVAQFSCLYFKNCKYLYISSLVLLFLQHDIIILYYDIS